MRNSISLILNINETKFQHSFSRMNQTNSITYLLCLCVFFGLISSFWAFFDMTVATFIR